MSTTKLRIFIATYRSYQAITKYIYDDLSTRGHEVIYHFSDDVHIDYEKIIEPQILGSAILITTIAPEGLKIHQATNHYKLMLETAIRHNRIIVPLMFFDDTWNNEAIQKELPETWQAITEFEPIHLNFEDFTTTLQNIENRIQSLDTDTSPIAIKPTQEILDLAPIKIEDLSLALLAEQAYEKGNRSYYGEAYIEAKDYFNEAVRLKPNYGDAYNNRALVYQKLSELEKRLEDLQLALNLDTFKPHTLTNMAVIYHELGQFDKGMKAANEAIKIDPSHAVAYHWRARINSEKGNITHSAP